MRVFIAGATGVIGRRVVPRLVEEGHTVTAVGRSPEKRERLEGQGARAIAVDLFAASAVREAVADQEAIVNLATAVPEPGPGLFLPWSWREMGRVRRHVSANLVEGALGGGTVRRLVQESFAPIYADGGARWLDESSPVDVPRYNRSMLAAEAQAERFRRSGRAGVTLRFGPFYGPDDPPTRQILDAVRKGWLPLFGAPDSYWTWCSQEDAARAVVAALELPSGVYNVVEDTPLRREELADGLARLLGVRRPRILPSWMRFLAGVLGGTFARSLRISNERLKAASGWAPLYPSVLDGIAAALRNDS